MQVSVENVGTLGRKLTLKIPAERLDTQVSERITQLGRTVRLKGFRPGRVPVQVIKQRFGDQVRGEALSDMIGESLQKAFEQEKLRPVARPVIDTTGEAEDGEIACTATFEVMPEFPEIDVSALEIERPSAEVADTDIDAMIDTLRKQRRHFEPVERASEKGDFVMFEYSANVGDYRFPEEGLERAGSVLDSGTLFEALEEALIGRKAGDEVKQDIEFPEDFGNKNLAGRKAAVELNILKVQEPRLPELDDAFIKQFGVADGDVETFRKEVRNNLERELKGALLAALKNEVAGKLAEAHPDLDVPDVMIENEVAGMLQGRIPEGQEPPQQALDMARPMAKKRVAAALLMGEIARKQELELDRKRVAEMMAAIASTYEEPEKVIELYNGDPQLMSGLQNRVMEDQVAEWVAEHARTTDKAQSFDEVMRPGQA
ncbi:MAG TPA: trigger factor [Rhodanobacteraceae bacterium]|nr:trigger factor [Rhodanobacteraceae bacterium]